MGTVAVLGLGPSLKLFKPEYDLTVGVNDIWRYVHTDVIVCVDHPTAFKGDRLKIINQSQPKVFYSHMVIWDSRKDFKRIQLLPGYPDRVLNIDAGIYKSFCSPFVAVQVAYHYHSARDIHIFGVDLTNHPHLDRKLCEKIYHHFRLLFEDLFRHNCHITVHGEGILKDLMQ